MNATDGARYLSPAWIALLTPAAIRAFLSGVEAPKASAEITVIVEASEEITIVARPNRG